MAISFIVTSYNVLPFLPQCLTSLAAVARPGDEVILVDDASTDGSAQLLEQLADFGFPDGVELRPVTLGANTMGGVGIPANIGLAMATKDAVFFVDGDDWIVAEGFNRARAQFTLDPADILIANYRVFDEARQISSPPADTDQWRRIIRSRDVEECRLQALGLIGVPWRKFYRRSFLEANGLRFPEGDFFYEDNPFHWAVCLAAGSIRFLDVVLCQHRVNRPGQTMGETGIALTAFFTHYETIRRSLPADPRYQIAAIDWLLANMAWHHERLAPQAFYIYASRARALLATIPQDLWDKAFEAGHSRHPVWAVADRLKNGDVPGQIASWENAVLTARLQGIEARLDQIEHLSQSNEDRLRGQAAAASFAAIRAMSGQ